MSMRDALERIARGEDGEGNLLTSTDCARIAECTLRESTALAADGWQMTPNWAGQFDTFHEWTTGAPRHLDKFSVCIDAKGRRCVCGADFMRARDEDAFPVRYFWNCQPPEGK